MFPYVDRQNDFQLDNEIRRPSSLMIVRFGFGFDQR